jgi:toxin ParE1/3/4
VSRYLLTPAAVADLEDIWDYTCDYWDADQAEAYLRDLAQAMKRAADRPDLGRNCDDIRPGYRKLATGSHTLYYRFTGDGAVEIVRILHQRMDPDRHL